MADTLNKIYKVIESRKNADPEKSYVASLLKGGVNKIAKKVGEEASEAIIAALKENKERVVSESADLLFHLLVLLYAKKIKPSEVLDELEKRLGISGLDEKAARNQKKKVKKQGKYKK